MLAAPAGSPREGATQAAPVGRYSLRQELRRTASVFPLLGGSCICLTCLAPLTMKTIASTCETCYIPGPVPSGSGTALREKRCPLHVRDGRARPSNSPKLCAGTRLSWELSTRGAEPGFSALRRTPRSPWTLAQVRLLQRRR